VSGIVVAAAPAVADRHVQFIVRPERELPAVVVELRVVVRQKDALGERIGDVGICRDGVFRQHVEVIGRRGHRCDRAAVVDVELAGAGLVRDGVIGVERQAEQAALVEARAGRHEVRADVEERRGQERAVLDDLDLAALVDREQPVGAVAGVDEADRRDDLVLRNRHEPDRRESRLGRGRAGK
jgi:hypothetical protein